MNRMRLLSPTAILGYGFPVESFQEGMSHRPDVIGVDAGSTDPGPYYLGQGKPFVDERAVMRDLALLIPAAKTAGIPLIIGTAGGSGARPHVEVCLSQVERVAWRLGLRLEVAVIHADVPAAEVRRALEANRITPLSFVPELTPATVEQCGHIVAQMGMEPIMAALSAGPDLVLAGRCYDPAVFAGPAVLHGFDPGLSLHLGKILECAAIAAAPGSGRDCVLGTLEPGCFSVTTLSDNRRFTVQSVAAHTMYEKSHPYLLPGPGGILDLSMVHFTQLDERSVQVQGSEFRAGRATVKIEGAQRVGYRTFSLCGIRDRTMLGMLEEVFATLRAAVADNFGPEDYLLTFRVYGRDGVMGPLEPQPQVQGHEVGLVIDVVAPSQEQAAAVCGFVRSTALHLGYPGRISTAGNLAFPFSPSDVDAGPVYEFAVYHIMEIDDPLALFPITFLTLGEGYTPATAGDAR
ncbi:MAG: DUF1446 domain-containing protein [Gaiellales bacterium]|nr:DUF1446 domain-containing protein [Gaiellales bacterium]